jgi:hypothetical protein
MGHSATTGVWIHRASLPDQLKRTTREPALWYQLKRIREPALWFRLKKDKRTGPVVPAEKDQRTVPMSFRYAKVKKCCMI